MKHYLWLLLLPLVGAIVFAAIGLLIARTIEAVRGRREESRERAALKAAEIKAEEEKR